MHVVTDIKIVQTGMNRNFICLCDVTVADFFEFSQFTGTRGHAYKLYKLFKPRSVISTVRMNLFANRVINAWNNLPTSVSFTSLPAFLSRTIRSVDFRKKIQM